MSIGIYKITSPSGKIYIGQSINIEKRWKDYKYVFRKQTKVYRSLQKYGFDAHKFEIIQLCNLDELNKYENYWKVFYLNLVKNNWKNVLFCDLYDLGGGPKSDITKQKLSKASKGKSKPEGFGDIIGRSILQYSLEGEFIKEWNSITKAKQHFKGDILGNCSDKQKTAGGYIWKYKTENFPIKLEINITNGNKNKSKTNKFIQSKYKPIIQYDLNMNQIKEWNSIKEAIECLNLSGLRSHLRGGSKTAGGFIFKHKFVNV